MKFLVLILSASLMSACAQTATKTAETAATPTGVEAASVVTRAPTQPEAAATEAVIPQSVAKAPAACKHGSLNEERSFILCEDGPMRKAGVLMALSAPHDPALKIESVAADYGIPAQVFTGIESATYGTLTTSEGRTLRKRGKHKPREKLVQIQGKLYDVYQVSSGEKTGTIFVERPSAK